jgi:PAS domain S-box-containing protein
MPTENEAPSKLTGIAIIAGNGKLMFACGRANDSDIRRTIVDCDWLAGAAGRDALPLCLPDETLLVLVSRCSDAYLVVLSREPIGTAMRFVMNVDFAFDIFGQVLTDPYDAMVVIDASERISFVSPVHEKFFGLREGEAVGKHIREMIPNSRLPEVIRSGVAEVGQLLRLKDGDRVVSRHPIRRDGKIVGAIGRIMFKGPQQVEELSRRVKGLERQLAQYKAEASAEKRAERHLEAIIGGSLAIESVRQQIRKVAPLDVPVLIQGESGTGKELVAQALHMLSARHSGRLVTVNAAALPASLVESELFGFEPGSFTGADRKGRAGKFELADKGTIFLDEIGDMPMEVQSKLLRVLQDRIVERVGGDKQKHVDFRLCTATNRDLQRFIEENQFRLDLFYRISPVCIMVPPLRERLEDVPLLLHHFVAELSGKYGKPTPEIEPAVIDYLMGQSWPGNVRQLRHEVERAVVFAENGRLQVADFIRGVSHTPHRPERPRDTTPFAAPEGEVMKSAVEHLEQNLINEAMGRFKGNKKRVAEYLGVSRSYLYKKLGETEIDSEIEMVS